jgi:hypothetical protein
VGCSPAGAAPASAAPAPTSETPAPTSATLPAPLPKAAPASYDLLTGEVQLYRRSWRLRYDSLDTVDPYGGCVTLSGNAELNNLQDGQRVRVRGLLVIPDGGANPVYQVQSLEILDRQ